jgi:4,5-dihydroxyphthalate decarboxylase
MAKLQLSLACWNYDRTRPLIDGRVQPDGIDLDVKVLRPRETFMRMLSDNAFHASELSLASFAALKGRGNCPYVGIPVALSKFFRHSCIYVRTDAGINKPEDLKARRVGSSQYGSTAPVYMKGLLKDEYGVAASDVQWFLNATNEPPLIPLHLPDSICLNYLPADQGLEAMLEAAELDALLAIHIPSIFLNGSPRIARLFPNFKNAEQDYYRRTRVFPIMHIVVIREDVHREHPWVAQSLYEAFCKAKDVAINGLYDTDALQLALPWLIDHVEETWRVMGKDYWAYGLEPNRPTFAAIGRYVFEQGIAPRPVKPEEFFVPGVG